MTDRVTLSGPAAIERRRARSREHWVVLGCALLAPLALGTLALVLEPDPRGWGTHEQLGFRPCFPMQHWNLPCPGCGVTTAITLAARGHVLAALRTQPFGPLLVAASLGFLVWSLALHLARRDLWSELRRWNARAVWTALLAPALLAWLYKMALTRGWLG